MKKIISTTLFIGIASSSAICHSQTVEVLAREHVKLEQSKADKPISKFSQWGDNEIFARYSDDASTRNHLDVSMGFRYLMTNSFLPKAKDWDYAVAIAYQGEFDFFAKTRQSSPVITTRHNPSIFYTRFRDPKNVNFTSWFVSLEHESNGQVTDNLKSLQSEIESFEADYANDNKVSNSDIFEMAQQTISRSNNFLGLGFNFNYGNYQGNCDKVFRCTNIQIKLRHQLDKNPEDELWWRPNEQAQLKEFVGSYLDINSQFEKANLHQALRFTYQTGQLIGGSPFGKHTFDLRYYIDVPVGRLASRWFGFKKTEAFSIPIVVRYHNGYLDELYNYSTKVSYVALGLHARY